MVYRPICDLTAGSTLQHSANLLKNTDITETLLKLNRTLTDPINIEQNHLK